MKIHPSLYAALLIVIAAIAFQLLLPAEASIPDSPLPYLSSGPSIAASGTMTGNVASDLTFSTPCQWTYISNRTGSTAYVSINRPTGVLTTSTSVFDFALDNGEDILVDGWLKIDSLTVYVSPTAGFRAVGW
jgi:hypothetical protein